MEENAYLKASEINLKVKDKKRLAICNGGIARTGRAILQGQVVDAGIRAPFDVDGIVDFVTGLFLGEEDIITPFLDFGLSPVRKPILKILISTETAVILETEKFIGAKDGFFHYELFDDLEPGQYTYNVLFQGSDSYRQQTKDLGYINNHRNTTITDHTVIGKGKLQILPRDYKQYIITSDIDQTYLATNLDTRGGKIATLFETPEQKLPIPGMPELYRKLRNESNGSPLCFISASPHFFRRSLSATIRKDDIEADALSLKYLDGTVRGVVDKAVNSLFNLDDLFHEGVAPAINRIKKFWNSSYLSLFDQLTYKLSTLLKNRIYQPTHAKEILMGDNTESDYLIFSLYQLILMGRLSGKMLEDYLYNLDFLGRNAVTRDSAVRIKKLASECLAIHGEVNSVDLVLINLSHMGPGVDEMYEHFHSALPTEIRLQQLKEFRMYDATEGALGFSIILHAYGILSFQSLVDVATSMLGKWSNGKVIDEKFLFAQIKALTVPELAIASKNLFREVMQRVV
ncbi:MAG: phosphatase domain-containing protein [Spirochaetota bacterium]